MIWNNGELKVASISDIHLGHPKTKTGEVLQGLYETFPDTHETGELDMIFIVGDLFDRLLNLPDDRVVEIRLWINTFLRMCKKRNIMVRVLEGTPSHDWKQSRLFVTENEHSRIGADLKYVEVLSIEYIEQYDLNILYIPDEWKHEPDDVWMDVKHALKERNLDQVDIVLMHGAFSHQLPPHVPSPTHDAERYLSITRYFVFVGHIHKHSRLERILAQGSHNRLAHGEEEDKGHLRVTLRESGRHEIVFVVNKNAKTYETIDCTGLSVEEILAKLAILESYRQDSYIRLLVNRGDPILAGHNVLKDRYYHINFDFKVTDQLNREKKSFSDIYTPFTPPAITSSNVVEMVRNRMLEKGFDDSIIKRSEEILNGHVLSNTG